MGSDASDPLAAVEQPGSQNRSIREVEASPALLIEICKVTAL